VFRKNSKARHTALTNVNRRRRLLCGCKGKKCTGEKKIKSIFRALPGRIHYDAVDAREKEGETDTDRFYIRTSIRRPEISLLITDSNTVRVRV
jgi:hypothetical protein